MALPVRTAISTLRSSAERLYAGRRARRAARRGARRRSPEPPTSSSRSTSARSRRAAFSTSGALDELRRITVEADTLVIGALATYTDLDSLAARRRSGADARRSRRDWLAARRSRTAAPSAATSPTHRRPVTRFPCSRRWTRSSCCAAPLASAGSPFNEFYTGYRESVRRADELIVAVEVPRCTRHASGSERSARAPRRRSRRS